MSQYPRPGVRQENVGATYEGTAGLHTHESGGVASKVVVYSELERDRIALQTSIAQLEQSYQTADVADTAAWQAATSNLSTQITHLSNNLRSRLSVAGKFNGSIAECLEALAVDDDYNTITQNGISFQFGRVGDTPGSAWDLSVQTYADSIISESWARLFLIHNVANPQETGIYFRHNNNGSLQKFYPLFDMLRDGALIYVDGGAQENTFWTIADAPIVSANDVVITSLIPFGSFTQLQTVPNDFLSIAANTLNANLDGAYFSVVNGQLTLTPAFVARITQLEAQAAAAALAISDLQTSLAGEIQARAVAETALQNAIDTKAPTAAIQAEIAARTSAVNALQSDLDDLQAFFLASMNTEIARRISEDTLLRNAINTKASQAALTNETTARTAAVTALQTSVNLKASQADLSAEATARLAADASLQTSIDLKASQVDLASEVAARVAGDAALTTRLDAIDPQILEALSRVTAAQLTSTIGNFYAYSHKVKTLANGVFAPVEGVPTTTFYVDLGDSLDWTIARFSETAAPYSQAAEPGVSFTSLNAAGVVGNFAKVCFQYPMALPDGTIEVFIARHYRDGVSPVVAIGVANTVLGSWSERFNGVKFRLLNGNVEWSLDGIVSSGLVFPGHIATEAFVSNGSIYASVENGIKLENVLGTTTSTVVSTEVYLVAKQSTGATIL